MNSQNQLQSQYQNVPQQTSQSVILIDQPRATLDRSELSVFQQNKNMTNKHRISNQSHWSEDEEYIHQNQQRVDTI